MSYFLLTRPQHQVDDLSAWLDSIGQPNINAPMLEISYHACDSTILTDQTYAGIILTSSNALYSLRKSKIDPVDLPVFTVGPKTTQEALSYGFNDVCSTSLGKEDLPKLIRDKGNEGLYLYLSGDVITSDTEDDLKHHDIAYERKIIYSSTSIDHLSEDVQDKIINQEISHILFTSYRSGKNFSKLMDTYGFHSHLKQTKALCLSQGVLSSIRTLNWCSCVCAQDADLKNFINTHLSRI